MYILDNFIQKCPQQFRPIWSDEIIKLVNTQFRRLHDN